MGRGILRAVITDLRRGVDDLNRVGYGYRSQDQSDRVISQGTHQPPMLNTGGNAPGRHGYTNL